MAGTRSVVAAAAVGMLAAVHAQAQVASGTVTGRVLDSTSSQPLSAVTVRIVGTQRGAQTRDDGSFVIAGVPVGAQQVRVTRVGYAALSAPVNVVAGQSANVVFRLRQIAASLQEIVTTGYGTQRREAITAAVTTVNADQANVGVQPNVNTLIQGRASGVQITTNSGAPGAGAQIRIRGGTSISASNEPLYVIDGVPVQNVETTPGGVTTVGSAALPRSPLNTLNPEDIADITILKDASATAIYGSRGANGVVLIQTKRGAAGTSTAEYNGYVAEASAARKLDLLSGDQYRSFVQTNVANGNLSKNTLSGLGMANTNWQDAILRTATIQNHNLSFAGGSQSTQYRASVNYFDQPGVVINNGFVRYQGRLNGTSRLLGDRLNLNLNLTASQVNDRFLLAENTGGFNGGVFTNVVQFNPTLPVMASGTTATGSPFYEIPGQTNVRNPVAITSQVNDRATTNRILGNLQTQYAFFPSLTGTVNVGVDRSTGDRGLYIPIANPIGASTSGFAQQGNRTNTGATIQTLLTFDRAFTGGPLGPQSLNVVGGYEYQRYNINLFYAEAQNFTNDVTGYNGLAGGVANPAFSADSNRNLTSLFARVNYGLQDKYFITGVVRRDGSSVFGANNKYAVFPAVSASWRIAQESFFRNNGVFSELRLRAGYGLQGNQAIRAYQTLALLGADPGYRYPFGSTVATGILPVTNPNPNLRWETTAQANVGIDYGVLNNRITGTFEYYSKNTRDLLLEAPVPQPAVVATQFQNIGRVKNAGFEGSADMQVFNQPGRTLSLGLVLTLDRNRVTSLGGQTTSIPTGGVSGRGQSGQNSQIITVGQPLGTFYGPEFVGRRDTVQLFNHYDASGKLIGTTTSPSGNDYRILGNANPKFTSGFRGNLVLGQVDASFLVRAQTGFKVFNNTALVYDTKSSVLQGQNFFTSALNDGIGISQPAIYSSRYIEDGSFIRLQNVTLGYKLPIHSIARRVTSARVYVSGDNLLLGTHYSGFDPEVYVESGIASRGIDYLTYPRARTFTFGLGLGF